MWFSLYGSLWHVVNALFLLAVKKAAAINLCFYYLSSHKFITYGLQQMDLSSSNTINPETMKLF